MNNKTKQFTLKELFSSDSYVIPIYQRNYAWGESEIIQLIQDIADYAKKDRNLNYYIGTLIVWERSLRGESSYETIDGQQRLTTLSILLSLIKNVYSKKDSSIDLSWYKEPGLKFDSRKNSTKTLLSLFDEGEVNDNKDYNSAIRQGYEDIKKVLPGILFDSDLSINDFCDYLFDKVSILRVLVPEDTDLNHYFEIMNSRGEQLEKHEILKAKCLERLDESDRYTFSSIWEACSNMERYVQYGFDTSQRGNIFGNDNNNDSRWNKLISQEDVYAVLKPSSDPTNSKGNSITIAELLEKGTIQYERKASTNNDNPDRFNTVVNFPNFLLHVLRIQTKKNIPLDDKRLIETFEPFLKKEGTEFVKTFGYNLLKTKFLFDKYIIKREFTKGTDRWSLKQLKGNDSYVNTFGSEESNDDINREILMLLSMFHVSAPALVYKHWLNGALKYVFENENVTAEEYKIYLENLAKAFLHRRYLSSTPADYYDIIYGNDAVTKDSIFNNIKHTEEELKTLDSGTAVENFIFNYLDYLLWANYRSDREYFKILNEKPFEDKRIKEFEFTFRSSVEHYYPQNPIDNNMKLKDEDEKWLDNFGNLCLISSSKNSRLSNYMPKAKKDHYHTSPTIDSIKQRIMMEYDYWDTNGANNINEIEEHGVKMKKLLLRNN